MPTVACGPLLGFPNRGHDLDNERSATIVRAPLVLDDGEATYNPNPMAYHAFEQYTVAHEGDLFGNYANLRRLEPPVPAEAADAHERLQLWLSKSKHGTYHFNPDGRVVINLRFRLLFRSTAHSTAHALSTAATSAASCWVLPGRRRS